MAYEIETLSPIPFLAELREEVLKHSLKRMPKWKFRFAPDLIVQLQPKPTIMLSAAATARGLKPKLQHFEGVAVLSEGVTGEALKRLPKRPCPPWWQIKFELYAHEPKGEWIFRRTSGYWQYGADPRQTSTLVQRVITTLHGGFLTASAPAEMLSYNCVICGKGLTDPASMARWIGPECAGTSTLRVPFVITANQAATPEAKPEEVQSPSQPALI
jgi:hypothetical protein